MNSMTISDCIQLLSVVVALLIGVISIVISVLTLKQNEKVLIESKRGQISIFPMKIYGDKIPHIKIQNIGSSPLNIFFINTKPSIPEDDIVVNPFKQYNDAWLMPGQSFTSVFSKESDTIAPIDKFHVTAVYDTLGKTYWDEFDIDFNLVYETYETKKKVANAVEALTNIDQSIQALQKM